MSMQRTRPTTEALQRIMISFKHFEMKLDKLQDDVNYHGQTLTDLRTMVTNLSTGTVVSPDGKMNDMKRPSRKTTAIQYEDRSHFEETACKTKRNNAVPSLPSKLKTKSFQGQKVTTNILNSTSLNKNKLMSAGQKGLAVKRSPRPKKAEAPRKATTLRSQKGVDKKHSKINS